MRSPWNANGFFGCVVDEKIVRFGRKLEAEVFHNKDEPEKCMNYRAFTCTVSWERAPIFSN